MLILWAEMRLTCLAQSLSRNLKTCAVPFRLLITTVSVLGCELSCDRNWQSDIKAGLNPRNSVNFNLAACFTQNPLQFENRCCVYGESSYM